MSTSRIQGAAPCEIFKKHVKQKEGREPEEQKFVTLIIVEIKMRRLFGMGKEEKEEAPKISLDDSIKMVFNSFISVRYLHSRLMIDLRI